MAHPHALINPAMLRWARDRVGLDVNAAARSAGVAPEQFQRWEDGDWQPTFKQAQQVASSLHAPFGYLFLGQPPTDEPLLPDLRTLGGTLVGKPSVNLMETVRQALQRQAWYAEFLQEQGAAPLPFVGRFSTRSNGVQVAQDIRSTLKLAPEPQTGHWEPYHRLLIKAAEDAGILVMRSGIVGNNTRRKLDVAEFRGFAISHPLAPVVFINSSDAPSARLFTLLHELAHVWLGSSGVSDTAPGNTRREEVFCNAVAGEFLAPSELFAKLWPLASEDLSTRVAELAQRFHVSQLVILRRAVDLGLIAPESYGAFYRAELEAFRAAEKGGGHFYRNAVAKISPLFARAVIAETLSGRLLLREAGKLLGVQPAKIRDLAEQLDA